MLTLPPPLAALAEEPTFCLYKTSPHPDKPGKLEKRPCNYRGEVCDAQDPANHMTAELACQWAAHYGPPYGVAKVFPKGGKFFFLDIDNCLQPDGQWSPVAQTFAQRLPGVAIEISASGRGWHMFGRGPVPDHRCRNTALGIELYTEGRFVALTGTGAVGDAGVTPDPAAIRWLVDSYFPPRAGAGGDRGAEWTDGPCAGWRGPTDDDDLLRRALRSQSGKAALFGTAGFADLWEAREDVLAVTYPADGGSSSGYNGSSADAALAQHLAFWTGRDCARIERLMRRSALHRQKWDDRDDYLPRTILNACRMQRDVLQDREVEPAVSAAAPGAVEVLTAAPQARLVEGAVYVDPQEQIELFRGCVYILNQNKVMLAGGEIVAREAFKARFGGYTFVMDRANSKQTSDAWEAFTQSQAVRHPQAFDTCFRPDLDTGTLVSREGRVFVNTYVPPPIKRIPGDVSLFLNHMGKLVPDARDRTILLSYFAACVQHRGVKFGWAPLIQGTEGNGKTVLSKCVSYAVGRGYTHWPKASKLAAQFNGWMYGKLLYAVEDMYLPRGNVDIIEELKPMITGENLEIEGKGVDQVTREVCGNFILNTNNKSSIRKTRNDRRYCPFFTPQQTEADVRRDGLNEQYMGRLFDWLKGEGEWASLGPDYGYAVVAEFLHTFPIPDEFNPAGACRRAPTTSSTEEAVSASYTMPEQIVLEAIEEERAGFRGGWVSGSRLAELMANNQVRMTPHARDALIVGLGYSRHPALKGGRPNNPVLPDAGRPVLYVKNTSPALGLTCPAAVAAEYTNAQRDPVGC